MTNNKFKRRNSTVSNRSFAKSVPPVNLDGITKALSTLVESDAFKAAEKEAAAIKAASY